MGKKLDITGQKFNRLTAIKETEKRIRGCVVWLFKCDCGNEVECPSKSVIYLKYQNVRKSCGCQHKEWYIENRSKMHYLHGFNKTRINRIWNNMNSRCNDTQNYAYKWYGSRGIKVCEQWSSFLGFKKDMYESYEKHIEKYGIKNTSLDRIDVNGNYCKENCRWATAKEQARNTRSNKIINFEGKKYCFSELAEIYNMSYNTVYNRIKRNWSIEKALTTPVK